MQDKELRYLYDYAHEFYNILYSNSNVILSNDHVDELQQLKGVLIVLRQLVVANPNEVKAQLTSLQTFIQNVIKMLILKVDILQSDKSRRLSEYAIENRRALSELIRVSISILHFLDHPFSLAADDGLTASAFDQFFKKFSTVLACLNRLKDESESEYTS